MKDQDDKESSLLSAANKARTPINVFAIAMMACASVLGGSATMIDGCYSLTAFTYTIHAFIAVSGMFFLTLLFCRKGIYHPKDMDEVSLATRSDLGKDRPELAAFLIAGMMIGYACYQYFSPMACEVKPEKEVLVEISTTNE